MPHASLKLVPGVDQNRTPALNEAAISSSNLIRFVPDRQGLALPQKIGGWRPYYNQPMTAVVRALWAWADTNDARYLAVGCENGVYTIENSQLYNRSPQVYVASPTLSFNTTAGSNEVEIDDTGSNVSSYDSIFLSTHVAIDGLVLFGFYSTEASTANRYSIFATNVIGIPTPATTTITGGGALATFTTTAGSPSVTVTLPNHGFAVGSTFPILVSTAVGGITLYGNYIVRQTATNTFVISADQSASSSATVTINGGKPQITYYIGQSTLPPSVGYGAGLYGAGGFGTGVTASGGRSFTTTAASAVGTTATVSFSGAYTIPVGSQITISGVSPSTYNGTWTVTASTTGATSTVSFELPDPYGPEIVNISSLPTPTILNLAGSTGTWTAGTRTMANTTLGTNTFRPRFSFNFGLTVGSTYLISGQLGGVTTSIINISTADPGGSNITYNSSTGVMSGSFVATTTNVNFLMNGTFAVPNAVTINSWSIRQSTVPNQTVAGTLSVNVWAFSGAEDWALDNWGEYLIANPKGGEIYYWNPTDGGSYASVVPNAPKVNEGCFVAMPERQIVAYGSTFNGIQDPLLMRWCDISNFTSWVGTVVNQAGSFRIPKGSKIVSAMQGPQQGLIWTDLGLWTMQYIGQPLIWSFNEVGTGCGLIGRKAAATLNGSVFWMSQSQFFTFGGGGVQTIPCPIWDVIFQDIDMSQVGKIRCATNARFGEISWYYPTIGSGGVPTRYVKLNVALGSWDFGTLTRTAWIDQSVLGAPIGAGGDRVIYQHETSTDAVDIAGNPQPINSYFQTGWFTLEDGDLKSFVDQVWPDMKWGYYDGVQSANVKITFYVADYPSQAPRVHGPYSVTEATTYITPRLRGRLVSIRIESNDIGSFWRLGNIRYRIQSDGKF
jgi:hypothetical protein